MRRLTPVVNYKMQVSSSKPGTATNGYQKSIFVSARSSTALLGAPLQLLCLTHKYRLRYFHAQLSTLASFPAQNP